MSHAPSLGEYLGLPIYTSSASVQREPSDDSTSNMLSCHDQEGFTTNREQEGKEEGRRVKTSTLKRKRSGSLWPGRVARDEPLEPGDTICYTSLRKESAVSYLMADKEEESNTENGQGINNKYLARPVFSKAGSGWRRGPHHYTDGEVKDLLELGLQAKYPKSHGQALTANIAKKNVTVERRTIMKDLLDKLRDATQKHFKDEVYLSEGGSVTVGVNNSAYEERLKYSDILSERPEAKGQIVFDFKFSVLLK
ncbi:MAG: hypothetical protein Q9172_007506 [Xanthocarpia lactea]